MEEHYFQCPYCWQDISMLFDSSIGMQKYIEDCEVCCNPIEIIVVYENSELVSLEVHGMI
jgi:hypothetical protein